jgi:hypothetical protein
MRRNSSGAALTVTAASDCIILSNLLPAGLVACMYVVRLKLAIPDQRSSVLSKAAKGLGGVARSRQRSGHVHKAEMECQNVRPEMLDV